jgi:hypothetical protein
MPFSITRLSNLPALLFVQRGCSMAAEVETVVNTLTGMLNCARDPLYLIMDVRRMDISLEELSYFADASAMRPNALLHHKMLREAVVISADSMVGVAVGGMRSEIYGKARIRVFATPEEALDYCRRQSPVKAAAP